MKKIKIVNQNMLSMLLVGIIILAFAVFEYISNYLSNKSLEELGIEYCIACSEQFIHVYAKIPAIISLIIISMFVLLKIIYKAESPKRLLVYRIMTGIFYSFMILLCFWYSCEIRIAFIPKIIFYLLLISAVVIGFRNTYSKRILN